MKVNLTPVQIAVAVAIGAGLLYFLKKKADGLTVTGAVAGAVGVAADAGAGIVYGIGDLLGVPRTDASKCAKAKAEGDMWGQSLYCTPGEYSFFGAMASSGGKAWQEQYVEQVPSAAYSKKYTGPLVNDDGYDFGLLSG